MKTQQDNERRQLENYTEDFNYANSPLRRSL